MSSDGLAIDLHDVAKVYKGRVHALQGIEMRVNRGEIFGLLGPNGAGKSTLVKIMMTVIHPTRAVGTILGNPVGTKATLSHVGYLPENHRFPRYLTGRQTLEFFGALAKVESTKLKSRADELLQTIGMSDWADRKISTYSKGMMQRIGLGQALMPNPDLVVLDEPTDGVDPVGRRDIRDVLQQLRSEGKTVFINSHLLSELEMVCDRVAILVQGKVAKQGSIDELTQKSQRYEMDLDPASGGDGGLLAKVEAALGVGLKPMARPVAAVSQRPAVAQPVGSAAPGFPVQLLPVAPSSATGEGRPPSDTAPPITRPPLPSATPFGPAGAMPPGRPPGGPPAYATPMPPQPPRPLYSGSLSDGTWVELLGNSLTVGTADAGRVQPLLDALRQQQVVIRKLIPVRQSLEDLFLQAVTDPNTGSAFAPGAARSQGAPR